MLEGFILRRTRTANALDVLLRFTPDPYRVQAHRRAAPRIPDHLCIPHILCGPASIVASPPSHVGTRPGLLIVVVIALVVVIILDVRLGAFGALGVCAQRHAA